MDQIHSRLVLWLQNLGQLLHVQQITEVEYSCLQWTKDVNSKHVEILIA